MSPSIVAVTQMDLVQRMELGWHCPSVWAAKAEPGGCLDAVLGDASGIGLLSVPRRWLYSPLILLLCKDIVLRLKQGRVTP